MVLGSRIALRPPTVNKAATKIIGTAQCTSTSVPNTRLPSIAAIRPTPDCKPKAVDLKHRKQKKT